MDIWMTIKVALRTLIRNKMRTFLTMLGIIIGVGAVVAMLAITTGAKQTIIGIIQGLGNNSMYIFAAQRTRGGVMGGMGTVTTMKPEDAAFIQRNSPHIKYASPVINMQARLIYKNLNWTTSVVAGNEHIEYIQAWEVEQGNFFTSAEVNSAAKVCVIGKSIVDNLYAPDEDPVGTTIRVNRIPFKVIGVLKAKGGAGGAGDQDDLIIIPYTTMMQRMYKRDYINMIMASATSSEDTYKAVDEITFNLRQRHRLHPEQDDDFEIRTQDEIINLVSSFIQNLTLLLAAVASISLLVGGIGIMNIMLVSVAERIREIGIRMALGAKKIDILSQFLVEAITLSFSGGVMGVLFGYFIGRIVSAATTWKVVVSPESVALAMAFALIVGVFFGFYPAWKASKLDPIVALRHE